VRRELNTQGQAASRLGVWRVLPVVAAAICTGLLVAFAVSADWASVILRPAMQQRSKSVRGQTIGDAFAPPSQEVKLGRVAPATQSAIQPAPQSFNRQLQAQQPREVLEEASDEREQQIKLGKIYAVTTDKAKLQAYLRDADPAIAASAFGALGVRDKQGAVQALLGVVNDPTEPVRLQALQILLSSPDVDKAMLDLRAALEDADTALVACAAQELGGRNDVEALNTLADVLRTGDAPARLLVVQSIANNTSAAYLLYQSLNDPNETVRNAAWAILFPPK